MGVLDAMGIPGLTYVVFDGVSGWMEGRGRDGVGTVAVLGSMAVEHTSIEFV